jgi:integrase/recombinase XerD
MPRMSKLQLPFAQWPADDRERWENAFRKRDLFDDEQGGAHLSEATRKALRIAYALYLGFVSNDRPELLTKEPQARLDRKLIAEYVGLLRKTHRDISVAASLHHLRMALRLICPKADWSWLRTITKRIAAAAPVKARKSGQVTSVELYLLGLKLMDEAIAETANQAEISKKAALKYRDGLLIALLSLVILRRRTAAALRIGKQLIRSGDLWALAIPAEDVKGKQPLHFSLSPKFSVRIELYLQKYRPRIPGAGSHTGLWPSNKGVPMTANAIYDAVCKRTRKAFGFSVNPHRFRHAAGALWSIEDPKNVRGVKDLFGHASYEKTTEAHYLMGQTRLAGRALATAIDAATK